MSRSDTSKGVRSVAVKVECTECGATHVRPEYLDPNEQEKPDKTREAKCPAYNPSRDAGFEGCGEETTLERVDWWETDDQ